MESFVTQCGCGLLALGRKFVRLHIQDQFDELKLEQWEHVKSSNQDQLCMPGGFVCTDYFDSKL